MARQVFFDRFASALENHPLGTQLPAQSQAFPVPRNHRRNAGSIRIRRAPFSRGLNIHHRDVCDNTGEQSHARRL
jgi:hypothetical protein